MHFPTDKHLRECFFAVEQTRAVTLGVAERDRIETDVKTLRLIIEAPGYADIKCLVAETTKRAIVAGDILAALYIMERYSIPEPSMNKAVFIVQEYARKATYGDGSQICRSERMIREAWQEFRSVAHFWAAFRLNKAYPFVPDRKQFSLAHFGTFLGVAAGLYEFGRAFVPFRAKEKTPLLEAQSSWALPDSIVPRQLKSHTRPLLLEKVVRKYRAQS